MIVVHVTFFYILKGLVFAGIGDLARPAETLSIPQTVALAATGLIWSRYSMVIIPKNYSLLSVNVFVAMTQLYQLYRAIEYAKIIIIIQINYHSEFFQPSKKYTSRKAKEIANFVGINVSKFYLNWIMRNKLKCDKMVCEIADFIVFI